MLNKGGTIQVALQFLIWSKHKIYNITALMKISPKYFSIPISNTIGAMQNILLRRTVVTQEMVKTFGLTNKI